MNYIKITKNDIANGPGVRVTLWVSGCSLHCKGCHNPQTWDFDAGQLFNETTKQELFEALSKPYIQGITLSGGHPLEDSNLLQVYGLIKEIKQQYPTKDIWLYTGYNLGIENFIIKLKGISPECNRHDIIHTILNLCDVVVDGPYIEEQKDISLPFCGSRNQRIIDVKKTLEHHKIIKRSFDNE